MTLMRIKCKVKGAAVSLVQLTCMSDDFYLTHNTSSFLDFRVRHYFLKGRTVIKRVRQDVPRKTFASIAAKRFPTMIAFSVNSHLCVFTVLFLLLLPTTLSKIVLPQASGPYGTRITTAKLVDQSRLDPFAPNGTHRAIMVTVFYPIINSSECEPLQTLRYMPPATAQFWDQEFAVYNITNATLEDVGVGACRQNASVGPFHHGKDQPIVIFSPGLGASRQLYSGMAQSVASHGYLVVSIDHPYDAYVVEYPDGTLVYAANITTDAQKDLDLATRAQDVSFLLNQLSANNTIQRVIPGADCGLNVSNVAMFGHSFGGATAAAAMLNDKRITAGLNMDGTFYGPVLQRGLDRPFLIFDTPSGTRLNTANYAEMWSHLRGWKLELTVAKAEHITFSDVPLLTELMGWSPFTSTSTEPGAVLGTLDGKRAFDVITVYVVAYMDFVLRGVESEMLRVPSPLYPEVSIVN